MPTYNGQAYLPAALGGILAQANGGIEVIAVDDGSTDDTVRILEAWAGRLPLRFVRRRVGNWVANSNLGLSLANGEYACFLHQDDFWLDGRLARMRPLTGRHPAALYLHPSWFVDPRGRRLGPWRCPLPPGPSEPRFMLSRLLVQNFISMPAPLFRREEALAVGGMDEGLWYTADWDFWLKLAARGPTCYLPRPLAAFRVHPESQTAVRSIAADDVRRQLRTVLERHIALFESRYGPAGEIRRAADFAIQVNVALASRAHGRKADWWKLAGEFTRLGPAGWKRFLRDSRIVERAWPRAKLAWLHRA